MGSCTGQVHYVNTLHPPSTFPIQKCTMQPRSEFGCPDDITSQYCLDSSCQCLAFHPRGIDTSGSNSINQLTIRQHCNCNLHVYTLYQPFQFIKCDKTPGFISIHHSRYLTSETHNMQLISRAYQVFQNSMSQNVSSSRSRKPRESPFLLQNSNYT